ncbi:chitin deacetylase 8-like [Battus philenor]|uniref:chitin deacetylase 8-like n=1 Tax=Battus philenor TaxID=42288 RepID=UPI0035D0017E
MQIGIILAVLAVAALANGQLPLGRECDERACRLPRCRCSSTDIPGGLLPRDTPQFVSLTFDDAVNGINIFTYREIVYGRRNSNGCPAGTTFYVNHEYTNYQLVNELYNNGYEIALHSLTHRTPQTFWANASVEEMMQEFADQRLQMSHFGLIPAEQMKGIRLPFLQMSGNTSFQMMARAGFVYDHSWPTTSYTNPGLWPYTLDYASKHDCIVPPCPTASVPGVWVFPMIAWSDLHGTPCAMVDTCYFTPALDDEDGWYNMILANFERHYRGNRAPFGFYIHEWYLAINPAVKRALIRFLDLVNNLNDTFMVNGHEIIEWVQNPIPVHEYARRPCRRFSRTPCRPTSCGPLRAEHNGLDYWMQVCNTCPRVYPWIGNPLGR